MSGLPSNMDCLLVGTDKKMGTMPVYVIPFSNKVFSYIISSTLFIGLLVIIYRSSITNNNGTFWIDYEIPIRIVSVIILIASFVFFCIGDGNHPYELFFGIMGIIASCIVLIYQYIKSLAN
jgi:hypothetical protein